MPDTEDQNYETIKQRQQSPPRRTCSGDLFVGESCDLLNRPNKRAEGAANNNYLTHTSFRNFLCQPLLLLISTSITSHKDLNSIYIVAHGELLSSSYCCPLYVRYMSGTCPLFYRTYTGHIPDMYRTCVGDVTLPFACSIGGLCLVL